MKYTTGLKEIQNLKKINNKPKTQTNKTDLIQEKETRKNQRTTSSKLKRGSVKTAAARWRRRRLGSTAVVARGRWRQRRLESQRSGGDWNRWWSTSSAAVVEGEDGVGGGGVLVCGFRRLVIRCCRWVSLGLSFFFFLLSIGCLRLCCMDRKFALIPKLT